MVESCGVDASKHGTCLYSTSYLLPTSSIEFLARWEIVPAVSQPPDECKDRDNTASSTSSTAIHYLCRMNHIHWLPSAHDFPIHREFRRRRPVPPIQSLEHHAQISNPKPSCGDYQRWGSTSASVNWSGHRHVNCLCLLLNSRLASVKNL